MNRVGFRVHEQVPVLHHFERRHDIHCDHIHLDGNASHNGIVETPVLSAAVGFLVFCFLEVIRGGGEITPLAIPDPQIIVGFTVVGIEFYSIFKHGLDTLLKTLVGLTGFTVTRQFECRGKQGPSFLAVLFRDRFREGKIHRKHYQHWCYAAFAGQVYDAGNILFIIFGGNPALPRIVDVGPVFVKPDAARRNPAE